MMEKPMFDLVLSLPAVLSCEILSVWLYVPSLVKLDSAYCHLEDRKRFTALYEQPELVCYGNYCSRKNIQWLLKRQIRLREFVVCVEIPTDVAKGYLRLFGRFIQSVTFTNGADVALIKDVAECCQNLVTVEVDKMVGVSYEMLDTFRSVHSLTISITSGNLTDNLHNLPNIRKLKMYWDDVESEQLVAFVDTCPNLTHFYPHGSSFIAAAPAIRMLLKLSNLVALSLCVMDVDDSALTEIVKSCSLIEHLDLHHSADITDAGVFAVASALKLKSIALPCDAKLTDKSLEHLHRCASTLQTLYITQSVGYRAITNTLTLPAIQTLLSKAHLCRYTWSTYILNHDRTGSFEPCSNATAITVGTELTDLLLLEIARHCKFLDTLNLYGETMVNSGLYTSAGLYAVIKGCTALKAICVHRKFDKVGFADVLKEYPKRFTNSLPHDVYDLMDMDM